MGKFKTEKEVKDIMSTVEYQTWSTKYTFVSTAVFLLAVMLMVSSSFFFVLGFSGFESISFVFAVGNFFIACFLFFYSDKEIDKSANENRKFLFDLSKKEINFYLERE